MKHLYLLLSFLSILVVSCKEKPTEKTALQTEQEKPFSFEVETIVEGLEVPWSMTFLPNGSMLITEQKGDLIHFKNGIKTTIKDVPEVYFHGQGGLLDIELDPNYDKNGWIYISYASNIENDGKGGNTTIMRAKLNDFTLVEKEVLYKATPNTKRGAHFGSRIEFDREGYLYFSIGDRFDRDVNPQDITKDAGKIYRINSDGSIPKDNPFINSKNAKKAIFSYGHRNPQGMAIHPTTGEIWTHEHGPQGGDEISIIKAGKNYGWPKASFGINYNDTKFTDDTSLPGMEDSIHYWVPSIAPSGMAFITSDKYPDWNGNVLVGSLKFQYLNRCVLENNKVIKEEKLLENIGRVRCVRQAPDGFIYVAVQNKGIVRLKPTN
ncbi:PQQ-dependent sugar dehydrogenase [Lutibacter flavus]|uniref:Glucose/arabinose dehydrogenase, beta-propeller fold n=1 Tax=Lutibacter flavus TaxID=691689 RepID=A0A238ZHT3_9FLAO|nr:PQQ-dependent sugar dehydrogenase [Lutibacter flavus]SNR82780.1 Glucose/arabinose dehydrogenase, beta-propeller fold [Lutibacter flavus]